MEVGKGIRTVGVVISVFKWGLHRSVSNASHFLKGLSGQIRSAREWHVPLDRPQLRDRPIQI